MNDSEVLFYVINLQRSKERRARMKEQLEKFGFQYKLIDAIDANEIDNEELKAIADNSKRFQSIFFRQLSNEEVACAMSHQKTYQHIVDNKNPYAIILEDDVIIHRPDILKTLLHALNNKKVFDRFDCILLGYHTSVSDFYHSALCTKKNSISIKTDNPHIYIGAPRFFHWSAYAYMVSLKGATSLLKHSSPIRMPADMLTGNAAYYGNQLGLVNIPLLVPIEGNRHTSHIKEERERRQNKLMPKNIQIIKFLWKKMKNRIPSTLLHFARKYYAKCVIQLVHWGIVGYKMYKI